MIEAACTANQCNALFVDKTLRFAICCDVGPISSTLVWRDPRLGDLIHLGGDDDDDDDDDDAAADDDDRPTPRLFWGRRVDARIEHAPNRGQHGP